MIRAIALRLGRTSGRAGVTRPVAAPARQTQQRLASGFGLQDPVASSYKSDQRGSIHFMKGNASSSHGSERKNPRQAFRRPDHDQRARPGDQSEFWDRRSYEKQPQNGSEQRTSGEEQPSDEMTFFGSSRQNIPTGVSDPITGSSQSRFKSTAPDDLNSYSSSASEVEIDDFFAGFATTKKEVDPKVKAEHDKIVQPQSRAPAELASWTVPNESGVRLVRKILEDRGGVARLREIWDEGTKDCIPVLAPTMVIEPNGKIRMKRTATMREGRRAYVPPAGAKFPDHPFRSMRFFKDVLITSLEELGILHRTQIWRPLETEEEFQLAIERAEQVQAKAERRAIWEKTGTVPRAREPATMKQIWVVALGPRPRREVEEDGTIRKFVTVKRQLPNGDWEDHEIEIGEFGVTPIRPEQWKQAEWYEGRYHYSKWIQAQRTAERQRIRREGYKIAKQKEREEIRAMREAGMMTGSKKEEARQAAIQHIETYARQTGSDVTGWFEELQGPLGEAKKWRGKIMHKGGAIPRKKMNPRSDFEPLGYPIN